MRSKSMVAIFMLCSIGAEAGLLAAPADLSSPDASVRLAECQRLGKLGKQALPQVPALMKLTTTDPNRRVRVIAGDSIRSIIQTDRDKSSPEGIAMMKAILHDRTASYEVRLFVFDQFMRCLAIEKDAFAVKLLPIFLEFVDDPDMQSKVLEAMPRLIAQCPPELQAKSISLLRDQYDLTLRFEDIIRSASKPQLTGLMAAALASADPEIRDRAIKMMSNLNLDATALPAVDALLNSSDLNTRAETLYRLTGAIASSAEFNSQVKSSAIVKTLEKAAKDNDYAIRTLADVSLSHLNSAQKHSAGPSLDEVARIFAGPKLSDRSLILLLPEIRGSIRSAEIAIPQLSHANPQVRRKAAEVLASISPSGPADGPKLKTIVAQALPMLKAETDDEVRGELSRALEKFDTALYGAQVGIYWNPKTTVPPSLKSQWSRDRIEAATALRDAAALRASQLAEIRTALKSEWSVGVTGILIQALEKHGSKDAASQAFLQACIDDPRLWLRREAIAAIATVDDSRLVKIIEQAYTARDSSSRTGTRSDFEATVAKLIERQNPARWQAMTAMAPSLEKDLNSPYQRRQALAIGYVRLIGPAAAPMIPKLQELVKARSPNGEEALSALTEMGTALAPKTVPIFISELGKGAFYEPEVLVRLQYLGPAAKAALPALQVRLRESGSEPVVGSAIQKTIKDIQAPAR